MWEGSARVNVIADVYSKGFFFVSVRQWIVMREISNSRREILQLQVFTSFNGIFRLCYYLAVDV